MQDTEHRLSEPFAFALLQWPALIGVLALDGPGWIRVARIALGVWLAVMVITAYTRPRGFAYGNAMVFLLACVAGAWWAWPGAWALAWLPPVLIGLLAAQRLKMRAA